MEFRKGKARRFSVRNKICRGGLRAPPPPPVQLGLKGCIFGPRKTCYDYIISIGQHLEKKKLNCWSTRKTHFEIIAFEDYPFFNHDCYAFISGISNYFCSTSDFNSYSNVWCFHRIVLLRNMREIARELQVCFFGLQRTFSFLPRYDAFSWPRLQCARSAKPSYH